mgnify:CR=1 FL=1
MEILNLVASIKNPGVVSVGGRACLGRSVGVAFQFGHVVLYVTAGAGSVANLAMFQDVA